MGFHLQLVFHILGLHLPYLIRGFEGLAEEKKLYSGLLVYDMNEVLYVVKDEANIVHKMKRRKTDWIGYMLREKLPSKT
jgi:hypothetical protein